MTFATIDDYLARFDAPDDMARLEAKLADASIAVAAALRAEGIDPDDPPARLAGALVTVTCSVANRIVPSGGSGAIDPGATSYMETAGPYMQQVTLGGAYGTPKLMPSELALLGIGGSAGRTLRPRVEPAAPCCTLGGWRHD